MRNWKKNKEDGGIVEKIKCHECVEVIEGSERKGKEDINRDQKVFD